MLLQGKIIKKKHNRYGCVVDNIIFTINANEFSREELDKLVDKTVFVEVDFSNKKVVNVC